MKNSYKSAALLFAIFLAVMSVVPQFVSVHAADGLSIRRPAVRCLNGTPRVILSWIRMENVTGYKIERKELTAGTWVTLKNSLNNGRFIDTSFKASSIPRYSYKITAIREKAIVDTKTVDARAMNCSTTSSSSRSSAMSTTSTSNSKKMWGAYVGWEPSAGPEFEKKVGATMDLRSTFIHWGNENAFPMNLKPVMNGKTLIIFWEAMDYNDPVPNQPAYSYDAITRGDWDDYIEQFARDAKAYGGPVILIPFEEMNGDWYPWSTTENGNTPAKHIAAFRYIQGFFKDIGTVQMGWAVNSDSSPDTKENSVESLYPGDAYVDVIGIDGFNFGDPWQNFDEIFGAGLKKLSAYKKPIYIFSTASAEGSRKAAWITDALVTQMTKHPEITGWNWFNEDKEHDWRVWSDEASLKAFQEAVK